jgi:subtilase family serine protease
MTKKLNVTVAVAAITFALGSNYLTHAGAEGRQRSIITKPIDETQLVTLAGNTRFEASARNDRGRVPDALPLDHMLLQLKRSPELQSQFDQYVNSLTDKSSRNFRHWLTAAEQGEKYGLAQDDLDAITAWLGSHGFTVSYVYPNRMVIDFSGTAGEIREAFHTEIHYLEVKGEQHFANIGNPQIPEALAPAVQGVVSLHNFMPHAMRTRLVSPDYTFSGCSGPIANNSDCYALVPADYQTIYNLTPLYTAGITGKGQTVVLIEDTNSYGSDWSTYRSRFGLTKYGGTLTTVHPNSGKNCTNPGTNANDSEADLDVEMVTAIAPGAKVELASCSDTSTTFGGLIAIQNLISASNPPAVISISYGECEAANGAASNAAYNSVYQSAAAAGVSVFVAAGDTGASICARDFTDGDSYALPGIGVNAFASTPYNIAVGGTDFEDLYNSLEGGPPQSTYWNSTNTSTYGSAKSYIPEIPWNDSCASYLIYHIAGFTAPYGASGFCNSSAGAFFVYDQAGGGGPSGCATGAGNPDYVYIEDTTCAGYAKPSWQSGIFGNPKDGVRDLPDVSLFAGNAFWGHYVINCYSDIANGGSSCAGAPSTWDGAGYTAGGTSAATPVMAAIQALVNEKWSIRAGNPNPTYYSIAKSEFGTAGDSTCYSINQSGTSSCVFYDITQGDNDIDCAYNGTVFKADCRAPSGSYGPLGTQAISKLIVKSKGSGYTSTPTCIIPAPANLSKYLSPKGTAIYAGGTQATCTATINTTTHMVSAVTLTNKGQGYTGVPACTISGGGGSGAECMAVITPTAGAAAYQPAFGATPGWDMATGIGSVNAYNLVLDSAWK